MMPSPGDHFLLFSSSKQLEMHIQSNQTTYSSRKYSFLSFKTKPRPRFKKKKIQNQVQLKVTIPRFPPSHQTKTPINLLCTGTGNAILTATQAPKQTFSSSKPVFFVCLFSYFHYLKGPYLTGVNHIIKVFDKSPWILEKKKTKHVVRISVNVSSLYLILMTQ